MARRTIETIADIGGVAPTTITLLVENHQLGVGPSLNLEVQFSDPLQLDQLMGQAATVMWGFVDETPRRFAGIVEEATVIGSPMEQGTLHTYAFKLVPRINTLARMVDSRIFQDKDVKEIASDVFAEVELDRLDWQLTGSYPKRDYCVQYQESALAFVSRLFEEEGIYYYVEARDDGDTVVFCDDSTAASPIDDDPMLPVRPRTQLGIHEDYCRVPADQQRVRSGKFTLRDFNFENPALDLTCEAEADVDAALEIYDYPGNYADPGEGKRLATVRLEAEQAWRNTLQVTAVCPRLSPGRKLELTDAGDLNGEYFIVHVTHHIASLHDNDDRVADDDEADRDCYAKATLIPLDVKYRCPQRTTRPTIHGPQTARVVVPEGGQPESIHTDEHGRCKVKFHWDRSEHNDDKATYWMRVSQQQTTGSLILPRVDWEVIVEYLEGNPDQPIISGRLYNGVYMPPYSLPEGKTRTSWQTRSTPGGGGTNEIRLEDKAGSEEIMMHAQHDMTLATANNKKKTVGNNETSVVAVNKSLSVGADQDIKITKGNQNTIGADQTVTVDGNRKVEVNAVTGLTIHGSATTTVGGNQDAMVGNPLEALLNLAAREAQRFLEAKADEALAQIQAQVQGKVDQALGPIKALTDQAESLGNNMQAIADGDMGAIGGLVGDASGIPGAGDFARSMGGESNSDAPAGGELAPVVEGGNLVQSMANNAVQQGGAMAQNAAHSAISSGVGAAHNALASALGVDAGGGGGSSMDNAGGPEGEVGAQDETDRTKGPGHNMGKIAGTHTEKIGGLKVLGVLDGINLNVAKDMTQNAGGAHIEAILGNRSETADGSKTETALGLVVLTTAGESELVKGARTAMVGGAIVDKLKGSHQVEAGGPATFIGAFHKMEAEEAITFKCGPSEVVIDGSGISIKAPITTILAAKIHLPKKVTEI